MIFNLIFAALFWLDPRGVGYGAQQIDGPSFWRAFVFSIDTMATVGYGNMYPLSLYANVIAAIEIALGILFVALVTGVVFARFSRPTARILFSKVAVIAPFDGIPTLDQGGLFNQPYRQLGHYHNDPSFDRQFLSVERTLLQRFRLFQAILRI